MALTAHYYTQFQPEQFYHVYNRSVDLKPMFRNKGNYDFFLKKYNEYLSDVLDTYAYCLLGNHFHLLVKIKSELSLNKFDSDQRSDKLKTPHDIVSFQFRKFFQSYSMAYNKAFERIGTLFQTPFKRALVDNPSYLKRLIYYIHFNPQHHNLVDDFKDWEWSSYKRFLIDNPSQLRKSEVYNLFGVKELFISYHNLFWDDLFNESFFSLKIFKISYPFKSFSIDLTTFKKLSNLY